MDRYPHPQPTPRPQDTSYIGKPITYVRGPNAGKTIRAELQEYQKPDLGRKFAKRDRRPLDPPPVVRVRMWEVFDVGLPTQSERELAADDIEVQGLVAHVDLFRVNQDHTIASDNPNETQNLTKHTFGSSFVHATHILDLTGQPVIIFVFADLSVRLEGVFALRYRIFDLVSRVDGTDAIPVAAELYGGVFTVYSTKEFPGLQASTALTKHLSRWGVRVNLREGERKRKADEGDDDDDDDGDGDDDGGAGEGGAPGSPKKSGHGSKAPRGGGHAKKGKSGSKGGNEPLPVVASTSGSQPFPQYQPAPTFASAPGSRQPLATPPGSDSQSRTAVRTESEVGDENSTHDGSARQEVRPEWINSISQPVDWSRPPVVSSQPPNWSRPPTISNHSAIGDWSRQPTQSPGRNVQETVAASPQERPQSQQQQRQPQQSRKRPRVTVPNTSNVYELDPSSALTARPEDVVPVADLTISPSTRMMSASSLSISQSPTFMAHSATPSSYEQQAVHQASYAPSPVGHLPQGQQRPTNFQQAAYPVPSPVQVPNHAAIPPSGHIHPATAYAVSSSNPQYAYRSAR